jgi:mono/diheme cytochrome c family protein
MTVPKLPKVLILFAILALAGAALVAGCGGGDSTTAPTTTEEAPAPAEEEEPAEEEPAEEEGAEEEPAEEPEEPAEEEPAEGEEPEGGESAMAGEGKSIFSANCASCHTLEAAAATGTVGPDLDELKPDEAAVEKQVINGGGAMPAFGKDEILTPEEIEAVSKYVADEAGK